MAEQLTSKTLKLSKETLTRLDGEQLVTIQGGLTELTDFTCDDYKPTPKCYTTTRG